MKILSFDVGIKNLAMCILEYKDDNLHIHKWDVINLIEDSIINYKCIDDLCTKNCTTYVEYDNINYYFCKKHLTNKNNILNNIFKNILENNWVMSNNLLCSTCLDNKNKKVVYTNNTNNNNLCIKHYNLFLKKLNNCYNKNNNINNKISKNFNVDDIKLALIKCLELHKIELINVNTVLIENQPTLKNPTMKAISDTIYTWFLIRGIIDKQINNSSIEKIKFISPSNKLKEFDQKNIIEADDNKKYKETKKLSIETTQNILNYYKLTNWTEIFINHKKKDDLADSFLQGIYFLNKEFSFINNIINNNYTQES